MVELQRINDLAERVEYAPPRFLMSEVPRGLSEVPRGLAFSYERGTPV